MKTRGASLFSCEANIQDMQELVAEIDKTKRSISDATDPKFKEALKEKLWALQEHEEILEFMDDNKKEEN